MCLTRPARLIDVEPNGAAGFVELNGRRERVSLAVLAAGPVAPEPGDWVLVNTGIALALMERSEAEQLLELWGEIDEMDEEKK